MNNKKKFLFKRKGMGDLDQKILDVTVEGFFGYVFLWINKYKAAYWYVYASEMIPVAKWILGCWNIFLWFYLPQLYERPSTIFNLEQYLFG